MSYTQSFQVRFHTLLRYQRVFGQHRVVLGYVLFFTTEPFAECCLEERVTIKVVFPVILYYIGDELLQLGIAQFLVQWDV